MSEDPARPAFERDFDAIEAAVMQTERGRWFLAEYHRRNRVADTRLLLDAISRLGHAVGDVPEAARAAAGEADDPAGWAAVESAFGTARTAIAVDPFDATLPLSRLFGRMIRLTRSAAGDILDAVERVQEAAWTLRESGADPSLCDELESCAARILQAAAEGAVTEERGDAVRAAIATVEDRLTALRRNRLGLTEEAEPAGTPRPEPDRPSAPSPAREPEPAAPSIPPSLAAIDAIDFRQRLKLFT